MVIGVAYEENTKYIISTFSVLHITIVVLPLLFDKQLKVQCFNKPPLTMPAGVSWTRYLKMLTASVLSMFAGAEVVHRYYRPDLTIPDVPPNPGELRTELLGVKAHQTEKVQTSQ
ncbi:hypothetical protein NDU88_004051 [Pleurodeles waltl]|uniref:Uncharacterized protein n=1 Tax=Pleurodeles waltl TaxID=8319 RepID=A0AAV7SHT5_PLEWA|nr:hypothetical protein NDU88_004051 [Pleurodeles waltl]